jgi:hypothetical protein
VWAADAAGDPDPTVLAESRCLFIARYVGTRYQRYGVTRGYIDACHAAGVGVGLIFEEWGSQFLGGYQAAVACGQRMLASWDALGAPRDGSVIPLVVIVDPSPSAVYGNENAVRDFARGWHDLLTSEGFPEWTGYGSRYGLDLAGEAAPSMTRRWGVGTWGYGERRDGSLPDDVPADMIQHGNRAAPVPGTDYNTLFRLDMGQWGGPAVAPPRRKEHQVWSAIIVGPDGLPISYAVAGSTILFQDDPTKPRGIYGIPQAAIDRGVCVRVDDKPAPDGRPGTAWDRLRAASDASLVMPTAGVPGEPAPVDVSGVLSAIDALREQVVRLGS